MKDTKANVLEGFQVTNITQTVFAAVGEERFIDDIFKNEDPSTIIILSDDGTGITDYSSLNLADFLSKRVIRIEIPKDDSLNAYRVARFLAGLTSKTKRHVIVYGVLKWSELEDKSIKTLHNLTTKRALNNFEISKIDNLDINSPNVAKAVLYYLHFKGTKRANFDKPYVYFSRGEPEKDEYITLMGFGDVMLDRSVESLMNRNGLDYPFEKIHENLGGTDFVFANLEGPIKEIPVRTSKSISFRFKPDVVWVLKNAGINIVSIANNHALDQGWGGRDDTIRFLTEAGIRFFGHPKNEKEENIYMTEVADQKIAFIGFDDTIFRINEAQTSEMIKELDAQVDYVVVSVHWGVEYVHQPTQRKQNLAHMFVDSGADLVIGHHPHVVQTMEIYNNVPIFYSLGNFVFDQYFSVDTQEGLGIGTVLEDNQTTVYLFPYSIPNSQPTLMNEEEKTTFLDKFISWGSYDENLTNDIKRGQIILRHD